MSYMQEFDRSYERIFGHQTKINDSGLAFFDYFYKRFTESNTEVAETFKNTDMERQKGMLKKSLLYCVSFMLSEQNTSHLERIAILHDKNHHNIKPELYDIWLDCMVETAKEFDDKFNDTVELSWRLALAPGITYMKYVYTKSA